MWYINNKEINDEDIPVNAIGFIYLITNQKTGKKYIGRKLLTKATAKKQVIKKDGSKSLKKKSQPRTQSNWKKYWGSCKELIEDIKEIGESCFHREIICFCDGVAKLNYMEAKHQFMNNVLESEEWYNSNIMIRAYKRNIFGKV